MADESNPRIKPILPPDWNATIRDAVSAFPTGRDFILNNWQTGEARGMNGVGAILNHPPLAKAFLTFNNHIAKDNTLTKRDCELAILRVSWLRKSEYEYQQHVILGLRAGLTELEISRIGIGSKAPEWGAQDACLLRAAEELIEKACIQSDTWNELRQFYSEEQTIDLVFTVGCYEVLAMAFKSFHVEFEPSLEPMSTEDKNIMYQQI